jgi:hypothetical protein
MADAYPGSGRELCSFSQTVGLGRGFQDAVRAAGISPAGR